MIRGLRCEVYVERRHPAGWTNGGASSTKDSFIIEGEGIDETEDMAEVMVVTPWKGFLRATPKGMDPGRWPMFGGNFLYSSDGRFPVSLDGWHHPIPIHDRFE